MENSEVGKDLVLAGFAKIFIAGKFLCRFLKTVKKSFSGSDGFISRCFSSEGFNPHYLSTFNIHLTLQIITYTYNFPMEVNVLLDKQLGRLYGWHNARMHLASCLSIQKLGLFHHLHFTEEKQSNEVYFYDNSVGLRCL